MKKIVAIIMILIIVMSVFAGCGKKAATTDTETNINNQENITSQLTNEDQTATETDSEQIINKKGVAFEVNTDISGEIKSSVNPLNSNKIILNGVEFGLPCPTADLFNKGFSLRDNLSFQNSFKANMKTNLSGFFDLIYDEKYTCASIKAIYNGADSEKTLEECELYQISIDCGNMDENSFCDFVLPGGITKNSTAADVLNVYGNPYDNAYFESGSTGRNVLAYWNNNSSVSYEFKFNDGGTIDSISIGYKAIVVGYYS